MCVKTVNVPSSMMGRPAPAATLYERVGGQAALEALTATLYTKIGAVQELAPFFVNVPVATIQSHQGHFFKVLFGPEEEKPSADELLEFMMRTHVRLFRKLGLNASHFDLVAGCLVASMNELNVPADLQKECLAIVGPLRVAFEQGATLADREKEEKQQEQEDNKCNKNKGDASTTIVQAATHTIKLPSCVEPPPEWLVQFLGGREHVRAWTCALTHRFTVQDELLSPIFMQLAYPDMEPYCHALLQIAFAHYLDGGGRNSDNRTDAKSSLQVLRAVRFPGGLLRPSLQLTKTMYARMVGQHFLQVALELEAEGLCWLHTDELTAVVDKLQCHKSVFIGEESQSGDSASSTPPPQEHNHRLRRTPSLRNRRRGELKHKNRQLSKEEQVGQTEKSDSTAKEKRANAGNKNLKCKSSQTTTSPRFPGKVSRGWWFQRRRR